MSGYSAQTWGWAEEIGRGHVVPAFTLRERTRLAETRRAYLSGQINDLTLSDLRLLFAQHLYRAGHLTADDFASEPRVTSRAWRG